MSDRASCYRRIPLIERYKDFLPVTEVEVEGTKVLVVQDDQGLWFTRSSAAGVLGLRAFVASIPIADPVLAAVTRAVMLTRPDSPGSPPLVRRAVRYGASPRGGQALVQEG